MLFQLGIRKYAHVVHNLIQIEDIVAEALLVPARANVIVRVHDAIEQNRRVLNNAVQRAQLLKHLAPNQVRIGILGCDDDASETACEIA